LADEDAPPTNSIYDIPNETFADANPVRFQPRVCTRLLQLRQHSVDCHSQNSVADTLSSRQTRSASASTSAEIHYVIVFGYPPDKYSVTTEYFKSIGDTTDPDPNMQITNCFRVGYRDFGEAMRAVKRNGEILGGNYMVGVKWAVSETLN
jgi:nuclear pore complex protein Nup53